jgi:hypothetical protein
MKLSIPPKLVEKLVWVLVISFSKIFIPSYLFDDALLYQKLAILTPQSPDFMDNSSLFSQVCLGFIVQSH